MKTIPIKTLREALDYDALTGQLTWKERPVSHFRDAPTCARVNKKYAGRPALAYLNARGYANGAICGKRMTAHRVVWAHYYGEWPTQTIDHINLDKSDNRIENLRLATFSQQKMNSTSYRGSTSVFKGVTWCKAKSRWIARIRRENKLFHLGQFADEIEAARAYDAAAARLHGIFAKLNFPGQSVLDDEEDGA